MSELEPSQPRTMTKEHEPHTIVQRLFELEQGGPMTQFFGGFKTTFSSVKFMAKNRELWPTIAIPAAINVAVFFLTALFLLWNHDWFLLPEPSGGGIVYYLLMALWWIYRIILYPLLIVVAYFLTLILAGIVASPFNEALSERAERIMMGDAVQSEEGWHALVVGGIRGIATAAATGIPRAILVVLLGLIPGIGPILAAIVGAYFIAVGYTDYAFERRKYPVARKLSVIWKHRRLAIGFGLGANLILLVPLVNFLSMPVAVVGGTAVAIAIDRFEERGLEVDGNDE